MSSSAAAVKVALVLGLQLLQSCWQHIGSCNSTNPLFAPSLCASLCSSLCSVLRCVLHCCAFPAPCAPPMCAVTKPHSQPEVLLCLHTTHTMCTNFLQSKQQHTNFRQSTVEVWRSSCTAGGLPRGFTAIDRCRTNLRKPQGSS